MNDACQRAALAWDMTGDGAYTVTDLWLQLKAVWLIPSNFVADLFRSDALGVFLELDCQSGAGLMGAIGSGLVWFTLLVCWVLVLERVNALPNQGRG